MSRPFCGSLLGWVLSIAWAQAAPLPSFDFRTAGDAVGWQALHDVTRLERTAEGLVAHLSGSDPYFDGPARDFPADTMLWLNLRLRSDSGGMCQVFYFREGTGPKEAASVRFAVGAGEWIAARIPMPSVGPGFRLRLDPPGETGRCVFERLWFDERVQFAAPNWAKPERPMIDAGDPNVVSGELRLSHGRGGFGHFRVDVAGHPAAMGQTRAVIGYAVTGRPQWWPLGETASAAVVKRDPALEVRISATDPDGAQWEIQQAFRPGPQGGAIEFEASVTVNRERSVLYLPILTLFAGVGTSGTNKQQALLAGVEYLENEPSSSEADLEGSQSRRQVTDTARLTFPLAAVVSDNRYVGLTWDTRPEVAVVFDSPDRLFQSGGHVMGLVLPGSDGLIREEGSLVPYDPLVLAAGRTLNVRGIILGGRGNHAVAAVRHYHRLRGLPSVPKTPYTAAEYFRLAGRGWLDSQIRSGDLFQHAVPGGFTAQPAADAAVFMDWLAGRVDEPTLASRLEAGAVSAIAKVTANQRWSQQIGHVHFPVAPLLYGGVAENAEAALQRGRGLSRRFESDGTVRYHASAGGIDYGRTHWTNEANGLTAQLVQAVLEDASFSGDRSLAEAGLTHLRALTKFHGSVPRGAQTWEVPLHTPDILAAAHLVRAHTVGYELSGEPAFLEQAQYWAWTGIPFVYLRAPTPGPVGPYATTPVLGATQWIAPNWIGLPVQWCGLVYGEALYRLARHDPTGPWKTIADGITASGVQQTYPLMDAKYVGLLPDSFSLKSQQRNAANINPATLLASATRFFGVGPIYDSWSFRRHGVTLHVPGEVQVVREDASGFAFRVLGWSRRSYWILLNGMTPSSSAVTIDGRVTPLTAPHRHFHQTGRLILEVDGSPLIEVVQGAKSPQP